MADQTGIEHWKPGVGDFLSLTFDYLKGDAKGLLRVLPLPWLLLVVLSGAMVWFTFGMATGGVPQFGSVGAIIGGTIVFMIAEYLVVSGLAVMTHRRMALGPQAAGGFRIGAREVFYLLKGIVFSFLLSLPWMLLVAFLAVGFAILPKEAWVFALVQSLGMLIGFCIMVLLTVRLMLALPAFAMDQHPGVIQPMKESWRRTRGCFWSLFLGGVVITMAAGMVSIVPMAASVPFMLGDVMAQSAPSMGSLIIMAIGQSLVGLIGVVMMLAYVTSAYIFLWAHPDRAAAEAALAP